VVAVLTHLLILWAVLAAALIAARTHRRARSAEKSGEFGAALGFIATSFGLLLGLLVVFATNHYTSTRTEAQTEATAAVALFGDLAAFPTDVRERTRHDVVCYMRAVIGNNWTAMERGDSNEPLATRRIQDRMFAAINGLALDDPRQSAAASRAAGKVTEVGSSRQRLLFLARPSIPVVLWVLIYVGAGVLVFLIASDLVARRETAIAGLAAIVLMLSVVIAVLTSLDRPFSPLARVGPTAMERGLVLLSNDRAGAPWLRPCADT
jgi:uncharacterized membrane protein